MLKLFFFFLTNFRERFLSFSILFYACGARNNIPAVNEIHRARRKKKIRKEIQFAT